MNKINNWKAYSYRALMTLQVLFVATLTWDFFLTVLVKTSHRASVMLGSASAVAPIIIFFWILVIVGLSVLVLCSSKSDAGIASGKFIRYEYLFLVMSAILYVALIILALINPLVLWPILINYAVNIIWVVLLIYFRYHFSRIN